MFKRLLLTSMPVLLTGLFAFGATAFADDYGSQAAANPDFS